MQRFEVELSGYMTFRRTVVVEAESEDDAIEKVYADHDNITQYDENWENTSLEFIQDLEVLECDPIEEE